MSQMSKINATQNATYQTFMENQKRLVTRLLENYDPVVSPIYTLHRSEFINQSAVVHPPIMEMKITLWLLKLIDVVEIEEKATFMFHYSPEWTDTRLRWDPNEYGGISHIYLPQDKIWMPEVSIADAQEIKDFQNDQQKIVWLYYNGTIGYYVPTVTSVICQLDVYRFPLDKHKCGVSIMYYSYFTDEYKMTSVQEKFIKPLSQLGNGEWTVTYVGIAVEENGAELSNTQRYEAIFTRNPGFYIALVMIPAYFINCLSIIALFIDLEDLQGKYSVGLTNIMAMTFILVILAEDLPKTKRIPLLATYVIVSLVIMVAAIFVVGVLPKISKMIKQNCPNNNEKKDKLSRLARFRRFIRIEYVMMAIFQIGNLINFLMMFL